MNLLIRNYYIYNNFIIFECIALVYLIIMNNIRDKFIIGAMYITIREKHIPINLLLTKYNFRLKLNEIYESTKRR